MTVPVEISTLDLDSVNIAPRFGVEQGVKPDGSIKLRPCDDETRSGTNGCTEPSEKLHNDGVDLLIATVVAFVCSCGVAPSLWKADIDSAYRRIPICPEHGERALIIDCQNETRHWACCAPTGLSSAPARFLDCRPLTNLNSYS